MKYLITVFMFLTLLTEQDVLGQTREENMKKVYHCFRFGSFQETIVLTSDLIKLDPNYGGWYNYRADSKMRLKDYRGAILDYEKSIELCNADSVIPCFNSWVQDQYFNLGLAKIYLGKIDDGCLDLSKSGELGRSAAYIEIAKYCN